MSVNLENFEKKKEYLICVDSDGCAMDTMDIKHIRFLNGRAPFWQDGTILICIL